MSESLWVNPVYEWRIRLCLRMCITTMRSHGIFMPCVTSECCPSRGSSRVGAAVCEQNAAYYIHPPSEFMEQSRIYVLPSPLLSMQICLCVFMQTIRGLIFFCALCIFPRVYHEFYAGVQWRMNIFSDHSLQWNVFYCFHDRRTQKYLFACWLNQNQLLRPCDCRLFISNGFFEGIDYYWHGFKVVKVL